MSNSLFEFVHTVLPALVYNSVRITNVAILFLGTGLNQKFNAGHTWSSGSNANDLDFIQFLSSNEEAILDGGQDDDGGAAIGRGPAELAEGSLRGGDPESSSSFLRPRRALVALS